MSQRWVDGSCHCGGVQFQVQLDPKALPTALSCNCSICTKKGFLHLIVAPEHFRLLSGIQLLSTYQFGTHVAVHRFCQKCGIHPFYTPRSHPDQVDVNIHCFDDSLRDHFPIQTFDGAHWEDAIQQI